MIASTPTSRQRGSQSSAQEPPNSIKSIYRRSSALSTSATPASVTSVLSGRKRSVGDDVDKAKEPESPSKRKKSVHFDMDRNMVIETSVRSLEATKKEVRKALEGHARGDSELYRELEDIFANERKRDQPPIHEEEDDAIRPQELIVYVIALTAYAPLLNRSCSSLVKAVLKCSYLGRDMSFFRAYCQLMAELVSAHGSCMMPVLSMMVDKFTLTRPSSWSVPDFPDVDYETMRGRLHESLRYMIQLFPKAARSVLSHLIPKNFPYPESSKNEHLAYVNNLLKIREYAPDMEPEIMGVITNRLVTLDSNMQLNLDDMDDELAAKVHFQLNSSQFEGDNDDDSGDDDDSVISEDQTEFDAEATRIEKAIGLVRKLDGILDLLFSFYAPVFEKPESAQAITVFQRMLTEFTHFVLPTRNCHHTQFLLFHCSQKSHVLMDIFVGTLFNLAFESNRSQALRQAAAGYLGSFVARGARVPRETVRTITEVLCRQVDSYRLRRQDDCRGPDLRRYQPLYCWIQALIYIFCFRWKDLVDSSPDIVDPDDSSSYLGHQLEWMPKFRLTMSSVIHSPFNPLKVCSPQIVHQFAQLAQHLHLFYLYPKMEANKNILLSQFVSNAYSTGGALRDTGIDPHDETRLQLEPAFPFDPYNLPTSRRWLEGEYLDWKAIPGLDGDEESEDESELGDDDRLIEGTATDDERDDD